MPARRLGLAPPDQPDKLARIQKSEFRIQQSDFDRSGGLGWSGGLTAGALAVLSSAALASPTEFTYQGLLKISGAPATGNFDLRIKAGSYPETLTINKSLILSGYGGEVTIGK